MDCKKEHSRLRLLLELTSDFVFILSPKGIVLEVSQMVCAKLGVEMNSLIDQPIAKFFAPLDIVPIDEFLATCAAGNSLKRTATIIDKQAQRTAVALQMQCFDDDGHRSILCVSTPLSSNNDAAAESLRRSEERLDLALRCADQGLWDWNIQTNEVYFSERWATMLGYELNELEQSITTWESLVHPLDMKKVKDALQKHLVGLSPIYSTEHRVKTKTGEWLWILDTGRVVEWDSMKRPLRAVGTHINIDEQKKAKLFLQNHLEQQEVISKILFNINNLTEFDTKINETLSLAGKYVGASRAYIFEDDFGGETYSCTHEWCNKDSMPLQLEFQHVSSSICPSMQKLLSPTGKILCADVSQLPDDLKKILNPLSVESLIIYPLVVSECMWGFVGFNFNRPNQFTKSEPELLRTVTEIITNAYERRNIERWLRNAKIEADNANRAKSEFLANMSHEIRTPLNAVLGISEALALRTTDDYTRNKLQTINASGKTLLSLINDILDLSRIEAGKLEIRLTTLSLSDIVQEVTDIFRHKAKEKEISISYEIDSSVPPIVELDETRFRQLLFNLIGNAVKFTHHGGVHTKLSATKKSNDIYTIKIQVNDSGIGIPINQQKIIFEAFRQQQGQDNRKYGGTGLGLAITKKIVELMHGSITLRSEPNVGSTFSIELFNVHQSTQSVVSTKTNNTFENVYFEPANVLIIDDIFLNIETLELLNQSSNIKLIGKTSGIEALRWLETNQPQLVLCDIRMPDLDGWQVCSTIKSDARLQHIPIVAYTASGTKHEQERIAQNFDDLLLKPASQKGLLAIFEQYLPHHVIDSKTIHPELDNIVQIAKQNTEFIAQLQEMCKISEILSLEYIDMNQMERFAKQLNKLVADLQIEALSSFAQQFTVCCETFDLEKIEQTKKTIAELIK